ncbi:MFS transporter [Reichenbachiella sp.]|uniref:MFS transporter n=1 Tax=Reichenbachiella sp. TaxID=2184521 RepID=UPI00329A2EF5
MVASAQIGCMIGSILSGYTSRRIGRKKSLLIAAILFVVSALGSAFPYSVIELVAYRVIGGVGVGLASAFAPMYIAELAPKGVRGKLVSINQLSILLWFVVVFFVNYSIQDPVELISNEHKSWRWMFGSECISAVLSFVLVLSISKSPRWLMLNGWEDEAQYGLNKIDSDHAESEIRKIKETFNNKEKLDVLDDYKNATLKLSECVA